MHEELGQIMSDWRTYTDPIGDRTYDDANRPDEEWVPDGPDFGQQYELTIAWDALTQAEALLTASVIQAYVRKLEFGAVITFVNHRSAGTE